MKKNYVQFLTRTALLLALCVVVQQFKSVSQFITGPMVNIILMVAALAVGLASGLTIAVLSPVLAFLISPAPIMQAMPQLMVLVMFGNAAIVLLVWLFRNHKMYYIGLALGAVAKAGVLALGLQLVVLPLFGGGLAEKQVTAVTAMFGINQLITAAIAGVVVAIVWPMLKKVNGFVLESNK